MQKIIRRRVIFSCIRFFHFTVKHSFYHEFNSERTIQQKCDRSFFIDERK
ncbi:CLUMA_CG009500, isoform A [Clunio marinus]|uniref:CLUMA_CG009500, isoform A n=1 Tax=Clunio marinus TaxID=568069 RepID=A0A1J1I6Y1_9DIPT|nr:CLUMA_CG009500, isoform A [Clunio marinus]